MRFALTVPAAAMPSDFNNRRRFGLVEKLFTTEWLVEFVIAGNLETSDIIAEPQDQVLCHS